MAIVEARGISKRFLLRHNRYGSLKERFLGALHASRREQVEEFWALRDVTLAVNPGEAIGLVGRNGSGKSTFLRLVAGITRPTTGSLAVLRRARIGTMIELGVGFHGELTGRENVFLNASVHGLTRRAIEDIYGAIVEYADLERFMDVPMKNYSSGMVVRLAFAVAANLDPDLLLLDEVFAVGDEGFQRKCMKTMQEFRSEGKTILFVSHSAAAIRFVCDRVCVLDRGRLIFDGGVSQGLEEYERVSGGGAAAAAGELGKASAELQGELAGGQSADAARWRYDFLRREGLRAGQSVLEVDRDYVGVAAAQSYDFAIADGLVAELNLNRVARCIATVVHQLAPSGRFYLTWFDNPDPASFEPIDRGEGLVTFPDAAPYHYFYAQLAQLCESLGARAERLDDRSHPRGESVMMVTRT